jgi:hypothetical protein
MAIRSLLVVCSILCALGHADVLRQRGVNDSTGMGSYPTRQYPRLTRLVTQPCIGITALFQRLLLLLARLC